MTSLDLVGAFEGLWVDIECPDCKISTRVHLKEIIIQSSIICRGCYKSYDLVQSGASGTKSERKIKALEGEMNSFDKMIKINLKF
jgi:transposase-like protein